MVIASLSKYDIEVLKKFIGSSLTYLRSQEMDSWDRVYGNLEITSNNKKIEILNEQKPIEFFGGIENIATFTIVEKQIDEKFEPMVLDVPIIDYEINDEITDISIINDNIEVFNNDNELIYNISMDMGIVFHMVNETITFIKGWYFDESIRIIKGKDYCEKIRSIDQVKKDWLDPEIDEGYVRCSREETIIK